MSFTYLAMKIVANVPKANPPPIARKVGIPRILESIEVHNIDMAIATPINIIATPLILGLLVP